MSNDYDYKAALLPLQQQRQQLLDAGLEKSDFSGLAVMFDGKHLEAMYYALLLVDKMNNPSNEMWEAFHAAPTYPASVEAMIQQAEREIGNE